MQNINRNSVRNNDEYRKKNERKLEMISAILNFLSNEIFVDNRNQYIIKHILVLQFETLLLYSSVK